MGQSRNLKVKKILDPYTPFLVASACVPCLRKWNRKQHQILNYDCSPWKWLLLGADMSAAFV